jgi:hypothetical protein
MAMPSGPVGGGAAAGLTGERNEQSVLFSLNALQKAADAKPSGGAGAGSLSLGGGSEKKTGDDSGLIDLGALAKQAESSAPALGGPSLLGAPVLGAPMLARHGADRCVCRAAASGEEQDRPHHRVGRRVLGGRHRWCDRRHARWSASPRCARADDGARADDHGRSCRCRAHDDEHRGRSDRRGQHRHGRSTDAAATIARWPSVRDGERRHIFPHQGRAHAVFDSSLIYEPAVLRVYAERYLLEVPPAHPSYPTAYRLLELLDQFVTIYPDHVPRNSILREFIGGGGFDG